MVIAQCYELLKKNFPNCTASPKETVEELTQYLESESSLQTNGVMSSGESMQQVAAAAHASKVVADLMSKLQKENRPCQAQNMAIFFQGTIIIVFAEFSCIPKSDSIELKQFMVKLMAWLFFVQVFDDRGFVGQ